MAFKAVDAGVSLPALEEEVAAWWKHHNIMYKTLDHGDRDRPFVFFEGPPTANGQPGIHHVEARASKDIVVRFNRMLGKYVVGARGGWDTHGLPVEIEVEKKLGFSGKPDIERYGIGPFNAACRTSAKEYIEDWETMTERIAFWIDLKDPYTTYDNEYIESLWWIFKQLHDRDLLYRDFKVTMHCPRCGTSLSDHEVAQGYQDNTEDPSVWIRFRVQESGHALDAQLADASFVAWTTTPWTLPANTALAVNPDAPYVLAEKAGEKLVVAEALKDAVLGEDATVLATFTGADFTGLRYEQLYPGYGMGGVAIDLERAYQVVADDFVSLEDGTGIVHIAPAYGDLEIGRTYDLPTLFSVDLAGKVLPEFAEFGFEGMFFKEADPKITRNLKDRGLLYDSGRVHHTYPFCWRCKTPLLFYAKQSWYIRTTAMKQQLIDNNQKINWVPDHIKNGRFGNWLENNIDWAISRERYWGTPLPIWVCNSCNHVDVVGSIEELGTKSSMDVSDLDLHRPAVDAPAWACTQCSDGTMQRVPDVADCWFDSGSMPVAQWHYPFENKQIFDVAGQADFISEAIDQTRGWFYTLHAISTLLFDRPAYRNVICLGHLLDEKGEKMSKSKGNVVDPKEVIGEFGADAVRWYMFASAPPYNARRFSASLVKESLRKFLLTLWNTYSFFVTYANIDEWTPTEANSLDNLKDHLLPIDRWILARLNAVVRDATGDLKEYDIYTPSKRLEEFVDELSNWYVRRNRRRFWSGEHDADKHAAYATLYTCLTTVAKMMAPFTPFMAESLYQNLVVTHDSSAAESVHMTDWPEVDESLVNEDLIRTTDLLLKTVSLGHAARKQASMRVRQPLSEMWVRLPRGEKLEQFSDELKDELNIKEVRWLGVEDGMVEYRFKPNLRTVGRKFGKLVPSIKEALAQIDGVAAATVAQQVENGEGFELVTDGETIFMESEDILMEATSPDGYAVSENNGVLVALTTDLSDDLIREGMAREIVRSLNDARKSANLELTDRISATVAPVEGIELDKVLAEYGDYIKQETLCDDLQLCPPAADAHQGELKLDQTNGVVGVTRR